MCDEFCGQIIKTLRLIGKKNLYKQHVCEEDNINNYYAINKLIKNNFKHLYFLSNLSKTGCAQYFYNEAMI